MRGDLFWRSTGQPLGYHQRGEEAAFGGRMELVGLIEPDTCLLPAYLLPGDAGRQHESSGGGGSGAIGVDNLPEAVLLFLIGPYHIEGWPGASLADQCGPPDTPLPKVRLVLR